MKQIHLGGGKEGEREQGVLLNQEHSTPTRAQGQPGLPTWGKEVESIGVGRGGGLVPGDSLPIPSPKRAITPIPAPWVKELLS